MSIKVEDYHAPATFQRMKAFADQHETPFVVIDRQIISDAYDQLGNCFPFAKIYYAVKANPATEIIELLRDKGSSFDIASIYELDKVMASGVGPERISYGNTIKKSRDIRYFFANEVSPLQTCLIVYAVLVAVLACFFLVERTRAGRFLRQVGEDPLLAEVQGIDVMRVRMAAALAAGAVAGLGGGLYAHLMTYVEPKSFDIMLGVHALAYGLIGGLGTALGPIIGVLIDIGLLESTRVGIEGELDEVPAVQRLARDGRLVGAMLPMPLFDVGHPSGLLAASAHLSSRADLHD